MISKIYVVFAETPGIGGNSSVRGAYDSVFNENVLYNKLLCFANISAVT